MTTVGIATGAVCGMGKACAVALSDMVDALLLVDLDADAATTTAKELADGRALVGPFAADVADPDALEALALPAGGVSARYLARANVAPPSTGITVPVTYRPARDDR